jgi:hypothetical protein
MAVALGLDNKDRSSTSPPKLARLDTNTRLAETIEAALRESWDRKTLREEEFLNMERNGDSITGKSRRLSNLYGLSPLAPHVLKRSTSFNSQKHSSRYFALATNQEESEDVMSDAISEKSKDNTVPVELKSPLSADSITSFDYPQSMHSDSLSQLVSICIYYI